MDHEEDPYVAAQTQKQETLFVVGMIGIGHEEGGDVRKDAASFLESDALLPPIDAVLAGIPLKVYRSGIYKFGPRPC